MRKVFLIIAGFIVAIFLIFSMQNTLIDDREIYSGFTGTVDQFYGQNKLKMEGIKILYSLSLLDFYPTDSEFEKYNNMFRVDEKFRFIYITDQTKVYDYTGNLVDPLMLAKDERISFSLKFIGDNFIEAVEIRSLK